MIYIPSLKKKIPMKEVMSCWYGFANFLKILKEKYPKEKRLMEKVREKLEEIEKTLHLEKWNIKKI